jgi:putative membrane protein
MDVLYIKALHIIFVVTWFAGLFYIVRLFIYHTEAEEKPEPEKSILKNQFSIMEKRLWYGITWPSLVGTYIFGLWMLYEIPAYLHSNWLLLKLSFVFGLTLYHLQCGILYKRIQNNVFKYSSLKLRIWNEVATLFLVAIVFIVVIKDTLSWVWGLTGLVLFAGLLMLAIQIYRKKRKQ